MFMFVVDNYFIFLPFRVHRWFNLCTIHKYSFYYWFDSLKLNVLDYIKNNLLVSLMVFH